MLSLQRQIEYELESYTFTDILLAQALIMKRARERNLDMNLVWDAIPAPNDHTFWVVANKLWCYPESAVKAVERAV